MYYFSRSRLFKWIFLPHLMAWTCHIICGFSFHYFFLLPKGAQVQAPLNTPVGSRRRLPSLNLALSDRETHDTKQHCYQRHFQSLAFVKHAQKHLPQTEQIFRSCRYSKRHIQHEQGTKFYLDSRSLLWAGHRNKEMLVSMWGSDIFVNGNWNWKRDNFVKGNENGND